jgi:glycine cleavage system regulatory protein
MSPRKFGWADDIVAPRQEINTLALLYEQEEIQKKLPAELTPKQFLEEYRKARDAYRKGPGSPSDPERTADLTQQVELFGAKASAQARREPGNRWMLTCIGPDRPGVLAALAQMIAAEGGNIEGAVMSIVAGHLVTVFFVAAADLSTLGPTVKGFPDLIVDPTPMEPADADWPRPGSTWWHARARGRADASLLLTFPGVLAELNFPLIRMSSWHEPSSTPDQPEVEIVDLNFAIARDPSRNDLLTRREIESKVKKKVAEAQIDVLPARWPTQHRSEGEVGHTRESDMVMTVVGHAEPGFVHTVLTALMEDVGGVVDIRGSSMAILDGMTVLTVVFRRAQETAVEELKSQVKKQVAHSLRTSDRGVPLAPIQLATIEPSKPKKSKKGKEKGEHPGDIHTSTHELSLEVPEQSRVVMKVAQLLAEFGVNITWFVSHVREPTVGERWPICDIHMHLHIKPKKYEEVDAALRSLAEREGWEDIHIEKWSVRR